MAVRPYPLSIGFRANVQTWPAVSSGSVQQRPIPITNRIRSTPSGAQIPSRIRRKVVHPARIGDHFHRNAQGECACQREAQGCRCGICDAGSDQNGREQLQNKGISINWASDRNGRCRFRHDRVLIRSDSSPPGAVHRTRSRLWQGLHLWCVGCENRGRSAVTMTTGRRTSGRAIGAGERGGGGRSR